MNNLFQKFNDIDAQKEFSSQDLNKDLKLLFSSIPYIAPIVFFLPILINKESAFCRFHANQQLAWLIVCVVLGIICSVLKFIPFIGGLVNGILGIVVFIISVILFIGALQGYAIKIPFIGNLISIF